MAAWHRSVVGDIGLRAGGVVSWLIAWRAFGMLTTAPRGHVAYPLALALATIGFLAASAGSALIVVGRHLFDEVEVSARWRSPARDTTA